MTGVSYVITVYNKAPYLKDVYNALENQKGRFQKEYIFVDDGSTDESPAILSELEKKSDKVRLISQENQGPSVATNAGLSQATLEYVKLVDGDDIMSPDGTEHLLQAIHNSKHEVVIGQGGTYEKAQGKREFKNSKQTYPEPLIKKPLKKAIKNAFFTPTHMLAKNSLVKKVGACDKRVFIQDYSIVLRLANRSSFICTNETVFYAPEEAPGRMSNNVAQTLHDLNAALYYFFKESPEIETTLLNFAARKASGRSWKWAKRKTKNMKIKSGPFLSYAASKLPLNEHLKLDLIASSCEIFTKTNSIRKPFSKDIIS